MRSGVGLATAAAALVVLAVSFAAGRGVPEPEERFSFEDIAKKDAEIDSLSPEESRKLKRLLRDYVEEKGLLVDEEFMSDDRYYDDDLTLLPLDDDDVQHRDHEDDIDNPKTVDDENIQFTELSKNLRAAQEQLRRDQQELEQERERRLHDREHRELLVEQHDQEDTPARSTRSIRTRSLQEQDPDKVMVYAAVLEPDDPMLITQSPTQAPDDNEDISVRTADLISETVRTADLISETWKHDTELVDGTNPTTGHLDGVLPSHVNEDELKGKRLELRKKKKELLREKGNLEVAKDELEGLEAALAEVQDLLRIQKKRGGLKKRFRMKINGRRYRRWKKRGGDRKKKRLGGGDVDR